MEYRRRIIDDDLDELLGELSAVALEGAKAVGKTATAVRRGRTLYRLDDPAGLAMARGDPTRLVTGAAPIVIDEWQRLPESWDMVGRAVDDDPSPNRFVLTGSATPYSPPTHWGAGRIVRLRMRPLSLAERGLAEPTVSLRRLLCEGGGPIRGETGVGLVEYAGEVVRSGFPALRRLGGRALRLQFESYIERIVDMDFEELGRPVRKPEALRRWLAAYAAATATTASLETIRDAAGAGELAKPTRPTVDAYRDVLRRLWVLDPVAAWLPDRNQFSRLTQPQKHHLVDPALAAILLGVGTDALLQGEGGGVEVRRDGPLLGHLFESLVTQSVRVYARAGEAEVKHFRTKGGRREIDLIVERPDRRVLAMEVKLSRTVADADVRHLVWLKQMLGDDLLDAVVVTTGPGAYRRSDGIAVVPAALLGP